MTSKTVMTEYDLRRLCRKLLYELDIRPPLDPVVVCKRLSASRGRRIELAAKTLPIGTAYGALVPYPTKDLIVYQRSTTKPHQWHIIFHEVIHIVRDHLTLDRVATCGTMLDAPGANQRTTLYDRWQEWEAETGATILSEWATVPAQHRADDVRTDTVDQRLEAALSDTRDWL